MYKPNRPTASQKGAALSFVSPTGQSLTADEADAFLQTQEGQDAITADSLRAIDLADKAAFARQEAAQEQRAFKSDPDFRFASVTPIRPPTKLREDQHPISNPAAFVLAGNATFTIVSKKTGVRFTFKVRQPKPDTPHFVSLLSGPNNENDYTFIGSIFSDGTYRHGKRSSVSPDAPSAKAFAWFYANYGDESKMQSMEVFHEGRCCRCGRKLTVPSSIESGIGPECATKM